MLSSGLAVEAGELRVEERVCWCGSEPTGLASAACPAFVGGGEVI